ncbi:uncharacterized protein MONBRDRAFT_25023 [Monosiga brevicollis MX1]|uniref:Peptidase M16C associated domain-containing protein n=1 Tax=Monosiga brevicollis TaxID=81824 RepID=A9UXJ5_MONBE|nr:uncharacterized protein MONBRDRAFT_25023 [Monosiga brevicollis MX1]EDQ89853.1 predicted protein [Monosiga brevicollis MX1]|eukprot:XP_001745275.1 hypothetical protein [Monosiga brevicollis MX1]
MWPAQRASKASLMVRVSLCQLPVVDHQWLFASPTLPSPVIKQAKPLEITASPLFGLSPTWGCRISWSIPFFVGLSDILAVTPFSRCFRDRLMLTRAVPRSLSNFMNAFTAPDNTVYPFATTNPQDYVNLMSVYCDAVFFPLLKAQDFAQEGWRVEHADPMDQTSPLEFKGVVFNEMKGALSSADQLYWTRSHQLLHPDTIYSHVSGGEPLHILNLTHDELKAFHAQHYHPSNSCFITYGDLLLEDHLNFLDTQFICPTCFNFLHRNSRAQVLKQFSRQSAVIGRTTTTHWDAPRRHVVSCAPDPVAVDPAKQDKLSVAFLLTDTANAYENFCLRVLSILLTDGNHAPFFQSLIDQGIGSVFTPNTGFDSSTEVTSFAIGVQGIGPEQHDQVLQAIDATFAQVAQEGFEPELVEGILHLLELSQKDVKPHFGLNIATSLIGSLFRGAAFEDSMLGQQLIDRFEQDWRQDPQFFQNLIRKHFLNNQHRLTLVMTPDAHYNTELEQREHAKLQSVLSNLSDQDREHIYQRGLELLEQQNREEDVSCLPSLAVEDVERIRAYPERQVQQMGERAVHIFEQPTNGISYFRMKLPLTNFTAKQHQLLPLFTTLLTSCGAGDVSYRDFEKLIRQHTGGLGASVSLLHHHTELHRYTRYLELASSALERKLDHMFGLWRDIFADAHVNDMQHLRNTLQMSATMAFESVVSTGHVFAMSLAASPISEGLAESEALGGLTHVLELNRLAAEQDLSDVAAELLQMRDQLLYSPNASCSLNADGATLQTSLQRLGSFLPEITPRVVPHTTSTMALRETPFLARLQESPRLAISTPFAVNFAAAAVPGTTYTDHDHAALTLALKIMSLKFLHREIREKGGAYGGGVTQGDGAIKFYSYRDPNPGNSFEAFVRSGEWITSGQFSDRDLNEAKLMAFQQLDGPSSPGRRGRDWFMADIDPTMKQKRRERLLDASREDVLRAAQRFLSPDVIENAHAVTLATEAQTQRLVENHGYESMPLEMAPPAEV